MTGKDARGRLSRGGKWKTRLSLALGAMLVIGACITVRYFWGPGSANAQAPPRKGASSGASSSGASSSGASSSGASSSGASSSTARASISDRDAATAARSGSSATGPKGSGANATGQLKVMAVVNGEPISRQDLARECLQRYGKDVLESIVNKHLILQACQQRRIVISEQDVEDEISRIAAKFGLPVDRWLMMLQQERDITAEQYRREIIWPTLALRRLAAEEIEVTPEEMARAFEAEYGPKVKVRMIAVTSRKKADQLHAEALADPEEFGALAKDHSEDPNSASTRGLIPPIRKHLGDESLERIAFGLKEGEISPVIQVANQYLILRCEKHLPETFIAEQHRQDAEDRLRDQIRDHKLRATAAELFQQLQSEAQVVNVLNEPQLQKQQPGVAATVNGHQVTIRQLSEECLIRYGAQVLEGEINRKILMQQLARRKQTIDERDVDEEIARAADAYGYLDKEGSPDVQAWLEAVTEGEQETVELYVRDAVWPSVALKKLVSQQVQVTQEDLEKGFESNYGERVEVLAIVLSNQRHAQEVWEFARHNNSDTAFGSLAHEHSVEAVSRENMGKVPPIRRHGGQPLLEEEAFKLKPGEVSGIIATGDKYILLRCQGRTQPVVEAKDFELVKNELYKDIHEKKLRLAMAQEFDRLKESAQIDNFLARTSQPGKKAAARPSNAAGGPPAARQPAAANPLPAGAIPSARRPSSTTRR